MGVQPMRTTAKLFDAFSRISLRENLYCVIGPTHTRLQKQYSEVPCIRNAASPKGGIFVTTAQNQVVDTVTASLGSAAFTLFFGFGAGMGLRSMTFYHMDKPPGLAQVGTFQCGQGLEKPNNIG